MADNQIYLIRAGFTMALSLFHWAEKTETASLTSVLLLYSEALSALLCIQHRLSPTLDRMSLVLFINLTEEPFLERHQWFLRA